MEQGGVRPRLLENRGFYGLSITAGVTAMLGAISFGVAEILSRLDNQRFECAPGLVAALFCVIAGVMLISVAVPFLMAQKIRRMYPEQIHPLQLAELRSAIWYCVISGYCISASLLAILVDTDRLRQPPSRPIFELLFVLACLAGWLGCRSLEKLDVALRIGREEI